MNKNRWAIYISERFPLGVYFLLSLLFSVSSFILSSHVTQNEKLFNWNSFPFVFAPFSILVIFFFGLRLMDEKKDYHKDVIAHPERPLPRGLISLQEVDQILMLYWLVAIILIFSLSLFGFIVGGSICGFIFLFQYLMYREFWIGEWLNDHPFWVAVSHQIIVLPVAALGGILYLDSYLNISESVLNFAFLSLGAFFTYEVGRKMDPLANPVLKTYRTVYGWQGSFFMSLGALALSAYFGVKLLGVRLLPLEILTLMFFVFSYFRPGKFKWVEMMVTINLVVHLAAGVLVYLVRE